MMDGHLDMQETPEGFLLVRTGPDVPRIEMPLTVVDLLILAQSAQNLRKRAAERLQPESMGATMVVLSLVDSVSLQPDSLGENLHLELYAPNGALTAYSLSPVVAQHLADKIPELLTKMGRHTPTKN